MARSSPYRKTSPPGAPTTSLDSLEGVAVHTRAEGTLRRRQRYWQVARRLGPGVVITAVVAMAATWLAGHYAAPVMLFALLLGMAVNFLGKDAQCRPGIDFCARTVLRLGVTLLGARITVGQVMALGGQALVIATGGVIVTIFAGWVMARFFRLRPAFGVLTGGAVAICGASAALAIASILPPSPEKERDTALTVVVVTALSTVAMVAYPLIAAALNLGHSQTGVLLGATIHDVAQVVGAGYGVSKVTGDTATIVKLFRVALLLPVVLAVAMMFRPKETAGIGGRRPPILPGFLIGFVALIALNSIVPARFLPIAGASETSRWCLVAAISAVGAKTELGDLLEVGWRSILLIVLETGIVFGWALSWLLLGPR